MKLVRYILIVIVFCMFRNVRAQSSSIHIKSWVKKNEILLRWAPFSKEVFDVAVKNGYKIIRTDNAGNVVVIAEAIKPYGKEDTAWVKLIKANENAALAYGAIHNNFSQAKDVKQKKEQEMMVYNMMLLSCDFNVDIAKACGLIYKDATIDNDKSYTYNITINNLPTSSKITPGILIVNASELSKNPEIKKLGGVFKNKSVKLKWNAANFKNDFGGYNIERSSDSMSYVILNKSPVILLASQFEKNKEIIYYLDTFPKVKQKYHYRIRGINHFGELSEPSNVISSIGYEPLMSFPVFDTIHTVKNQTVYMKWRMSDKNENDLPKAYIITRSNKDSGPYEVIFNTQNKFEFTDQLPNAANFYKVGAVGYGGDTLYSFSYMALIIDTIPPSPPKGLKAKVDAKGNVTLSWDKNPESDVQGYKIFRTNALHEEFVQINPEFAVEPAYSDKLNLKTLSKKIYYAVNATDKRFNNSDLSTPVEVKRPDTIAPAAPIINDLTLKQNGLEVSWINSNSEDVKYYVLYRTPENSKTEQKVKEWLVKDTLTKFLDTNLVMGEGYRYKLVVSDEDDNVSVSNSLYMKYETGFRKKLTDIKFEVDRKLKIVTLNWNYDAKEIEKYVIYRCKKGGALTIIKTVNGTTTSFIDNTLFMGNIYEYRIKPVYKNGTEGIISDGVVVEY